MSSRLSGLTTVEIAIVLVVIGLLLGGVLKGQELIFNSKVKATYQLVQSTSAAFKFYQNHYGALPGDDSRATAHFPDANPPPANGNGDGVLAYGNCSVPGTITENCTALYDLRLAGLIGGTYTQPLISPFGGAAFPAAGNSQMASVGFDSKPILQFNPSSLTQRAAKAIDTAFDDGNPNSGNWRCVGPGTAGYDISSSDLMVEGYCGMTL